MINELLKRLKDLKIGLDVEAGNLKIRAEKGVVTPEIIASIKENKEALIQFLGEYKKKKKRHSSIPVIAKAENYELSSAQRRLWILSQFEGESVAYNVPLSIRVKIEDVANFSKAVHAVIVRHEILRTVFKSDESGEVKQWIKEFDDIDFSISKRDYSAHENPIEAIQAYIKQDASTPFDLANGPLIRAVLIQIKEDDYVFYYNMHHIICDGWSGTILSSEIQAYYGAFLQGSKPQLEPLRIQYKDYAAWQSSNLENIAFKSHKTYWEEQLSGDLPQLNLPSSLKRPIQKTNDGQSLMTYVPIELTAKLKNYCQANDGTLFMGILASLKALIYRYTNQSDLIIGTPAAGRDEDELEGQIGFYINTLVLRNQLKGTDDFNTLFKTIKTTTLAAYENQQYPFDRLVEDLNVKRDTSRNAIYDVMVVLQNIQNQEGEIAHVDCDQILDLGESISQLDLNFDFQEIGGYLKLTVKYNPTIYDKGLIEQFMGHYKTLLKQLVEQDQTKIGELNFLNESEQNKIIKDFNQTESAYDKAASVIDFYKEQVSLHPEKFALIFKEKSFTYKELDDLSSQLSNCLIEKHQIKLGDAVAIELDTSEWTLISVLAVLKSGAMYVPIDTNYPIERKAHILNGAVVQLLITETSKLFDIDYFEGALFAVDVEFIAAEYATKTLVDIPSKAAAYCMFTSGSTGKPKGVQVSHQNITSLVKNTNYVDFNNELTLLSTGAFSFDATTFEYWGMLLNGGTLVITEKQTFLDETTLAAEIEAKKINIMWFTAGWLNQLVDTNTAVFKKLNTILVGGDRLSPKHINKLKSAYPELTIINGYGPTENTTFSLTYEIKEELTEIPIGKPISNKSVYILDTFDQPLPIGVVGEICLGGDGVANAYINDSTLTAEKFVLNPFNSAGRIYRSGDLGKWNEAGEIEFLGRKDVQIKIRGYRISLEEIESKLLSNKAIEDAIVLVSGEESGTKDLIAYLVSKTELNSNELKNELKAGLPEYMIPARFVQLAEFPLNPNGKVDRKALPDPSGIALVAETDYVAPNTELEQKVVAIWESILEQEKIGLKDDFFDLGGHSLKAMRLVNEYHKALDIKLNLKELFSLTQLNEHVNLLESAVRNNFTAINPIDQVENYAISDAQRRLWILSQFDNGNSAYNMSFSFTLDETYDIEAFKKAIHSVIDRHEILRTVFKEDESNEIKQWIIEYNASGFIIDELDFGQEENPKTALQNYMRKDVQTPFDLENGPLIRAAIIKISDTEKVFYYNLHHIISDGWSMQVLGKDVLAFYEAHKNNVEPTILPLNIQYKDYAAWQLNQLTGKDAEKQLTYWESKLSGTIPTIDLPSAKLRPPVQTFNGHRLGTILSKEVSLKLQQFTQDQEGSLFMGLVTTLSAMLHNYTGQNDILVGTPTAGRDHSDLNQQIGFYVNTLVLRNQLNPTDSLIDFFNVVKENTLEAYAHQQYPFDRLVDHLNLERNTARNPLFDVMLVLQNIEEVKETPNIQADQINTVKDYGKAVSKFDLDFTFHELGEHLALQVNFNTDVYDNEFIEHFIKHYVQFLERVLSNVSAPINEINYLSESEKQQVLFDFNQTDQVRTEQSIIELFEKQVTEKPDNIAISFEGTTLTYNELNKSANQLANYLRKEFGVSSNDLIAIELERSELLMVTVLAVLKSGAGYLPIDPLYPAVRRKFMLEDSQCKVHLNQQFLNDFAATNETFSEENLVWQIDGSHLAYVIYTSGSTGQPKGVIIEHSALSDYTLTVQSKFEISEVDIVIQQASFSFDTHIEEIFPALISGARLILVKHGGADIVELKNAIEIENATFLSTTPLVLNELNKLKLKHELRIIISGGDVLKTENINNLIGTSRVFNTYGPSEATVCATYAELKASESSINIGEPIDNRRVYILNDALKPLPVGVTGTIYIGGKGIAKGYLNRSELSADSFLTNPFVQGERLYKSGDFGKWRVDGTIDFEGRRDEQIKIRGYRVELGEIETAIQQSQNVSEVIVWPHSRNNNEKELIAYIVVDQTIDLANISKALRLQLPHYMIPSQFIELASIPKTLNGKVAYKELDKLANAQGIDVDHFVPPVGEQEKAVAEIWQSILEQDKISSSADFFALGGNSLKIIRLINSYHKQFNVKLKLQQLFLETTLTEHCALLSNAKSDKFDHIKPIQIQEHYAISDAQRRLWVLSQFEESNIAYNMPSQISLDATYDIELFIEALHNTIERHEILRTVFLETEEGEIRQRVIPAEKFSFKLNMLDFNKEVNANASIRAHIQKDSKQLFDLVNGPLIRASLLKKAKNEYVFFYNLHHIISDGLSMEILAKDVLAFYEALKMGNNQQPKPLEIQYKDYTQWQNERLNSETFKAYQSYWKEQLAGELPLLDLPLFKKRPRLKTYAGKTLATYVDKQVIDKLDAYSKQNGGTLFMGLIAVSNALFHKYSGQEEFILGTPVGGRPHADLTNQIGFYINTLVLRNQVNSTDSFNHLFKRVKENTIENYARQEYPFDRLVEDLDVQRDTARNPIFDALIVLQDAEVDYTPNDVNYDLIQDHGTGKAKFDLNFIFQKIGGEFQFRITFNTDVYETDQIDQLMQHFKMLTSQLLQHQETTLSDISYLTKKDQNKLMHEFNGTAKDYPRDSTVAELFENQAKQNPNRTALVFGETKWSYQALSIASNKLAAGLISKLNVKPADIVGITLPLSEKRIIAQLAILKVRAAYLPLEDSLPEERRSYILNDCNCKLIIDADNFDELSNFETETNPNLANKQALDLVYIMYTSGSTGTPKGVMVSNRNIVSLVKNTNYVNFDESHVILSTGAFSFDATTFEYWGMLLNGGTLVLCDQDTLLDEALLSKEIKRTQTDTMWFTAGWFNQLVDNDISVFENLKTVLAGGDKLSPIHVNKLIATYPGISIINGYGPTENTTFSLTYEMNKAHDLIPIGKPLNNRSAFILDAFNQLVPIGVSGEICLAGDGLAIGYVNDKELTEQKFVNHPFVQGEKIYRSGDIGRWLPNGTIEFLGRKDDQVKIRGYRISVQEIENHILSNAAVENAVVMAYETENEGKELVAYLTATETLNNSELRAFLKESLSDYMLPSHFIQLPNFPLNKNGKVDKKALPEPTALGINSGVEYLAPETEMEKEIGAIWEKNLLKEKVGLNDDFFELGGHSLKAMRLITAYHRAFDIKLNLKDLFNNTTVKAHVSLLNTVSKSEFTAITPIEPMPDYPISDAQRRLWVLSQFEEASVAYNMAFSLELDDSYNIDCFVDAVNAVVDRHEILRTVFIENGDGELRQKILTKEEIGFEVANEDFTNNENADQAIRAYIDRDAQTPFNLKTGPLIRAAILKGNKNRVVLYYSMHHVISDGWSMDVLAKDVQSFYEAFIRGEKEDLTPLKIQYKEYANWQLNQYHSAEFQKHSAYWKDRFNGTVPVLDLPFSKMRPQLKTFNGLTLGTHISEKTAIALKNYSQKNGGTLYMGLITCLNALLSRYTGSDEFIIGSPIAGRSHAELENQIGFYVNTLALRNGVEQSDSFHDLYAKSKDSILEAYAHQEYPFDRLVNELELKRDTSRSALFDIMLVLQNTGENELENRQNVDADRIINYGQKTSKFDLLFSFEEQGDGLAFFLEYNSDLYENESMVRLIHHFKNLMKGMLANPQANIQTLDYLNSNEREEVLLGFNATKHDFESASVIELFEKQALKTPNQIALTFKGEKWTYKALNKESNQLANHLIEQYKIQSGDRIAVMLKRSQFNIFAMLAVLKTGASYVPVDYEYPVSRIDFILKNSKTKLILSQHELNDIPSNKDLQIVTLDQTDFNANSKENPAVEIPLVEESFIIYTSGSTGNPKGVRQTHLMLSNLIQWDLNYSNISPGLKHLQYSSFSFDSSLHDAFFAFCGGGSICLVPQESRTDFGALRKIILEDSIEVLSLPYAALLNFFVQNQTTNLVGHKLQYLVSTGEQLMMTEEIEAFLIQHPTIELHNHYGPSETHVVTSHWMSGELDNIERRSPIGKPVSNTVLYILDQQMQPVPKGVKGEVYIGGDNLALGYIDLEEQTNERFIPDPFDSEKLVYKSGDIAKWREDGTIDYLGRDDDQVKVRGFRIELGEVESAMMANKGVEKAVVLVNEIRSGENELVAYLSATQEIVMSELRVDLAKSLPDYMLPAKFILVDQFPMTSNGKIDKKELLNAAGEELNTAIEYVAPQTAIEKQLVNIWETILKREKIGVKDNFFDLGGHSLTATRILSKINLEMGVQINIKNIFVNPTIEETAIQIDFLQKQKAGKENKKELKEISL